MATANANTESRACASCKSTDSATISLEGKKEEALLEALSGLCQVPGASGQEQAIECLQSMCPSMRAGNKTKSVSGV